MKKMRKVGEKLVHEGGEHPCGGDLGREVLGRLKRMGTGLSNVGEEKAKVVQKFEHWGTTFVSPQRSGCCRLTCPQHAGGEARSRGPGLTEVLGGSPAGLALRSQSATCSCPRFCLYHWCF